MKPFTSIEEQLDLLIKKGLIVEDKTQAKSYLLTQNYYNLINGYGCFFPRKDGMFSNGTNLNEIIQLYTFEYEVKRALFQAILCMETHLKAIVSHRFSETYTNSKYAYLDINCYNPDRKLESIATISKLSQIIQKHKKQKGNSIVHYIAQHQDVPLWVLINFLDFGDLRYFITNLRKSLQSTIAKDLYTFIHEYTKPITDPLTPEILISFIATINDIRNVCAHTNRLLNFKCKSACKFWSHLHPNYGISPSDYQNTVYSVFLILQCFISKSEYVALHNKILELCTQLHAQLQSISINDIYQKLGFPIEWHHKTISLTI